MLEGGEDIETARHELRVANALASELVASLMRGQKALERAVEHSLETGVEGPFEALPLPNPHRAAHRMGVQSRLDSDPELQAFVRARIDRLTLPRSKPLLRTISRPTDAQASAPCAGGSTGKNAARV